MSTVSYHETEADGPRPTPPPTDPPKPQLTLFVCPLPPRFSNLAAYVPARIASLVRNDGAMHPVPKKSSNVPMPSAMPAVLPVSTPAPPVCPPLSPPAGPGGMPQGPPHSIEKYSHSGSLTHSACELAYMGSWQAAGS